MTDEEIAQSFREHFAREMPAPSAPTGTAAQPPAPDLVTSTRLANPALALADRAGNAIVRGGAGIADSIYNAGRYVTGAVAGDNMDGFQRRTPVGDFVEPLTLDTSQQDAILEKTVPGYPFMAGAADVVGNIVPPMVVGAGAVNAFSKGMAALKPVAGASQRMGGYLDSARKFISDLAPAFQKFGMGPVPAAGPGSKLAQKALTGAGAGAVASLASKPDDPGAAVPAALIGGAAAPVLSVAAQGAVRAQEAASRMRNKNRVPELADEIIRDAVGNRAGAVQANIGQAGRRITQGLPAQVADDPGLSAVHQYVAGANPQFNAGTTEFMRKQAIDMANSLKSRTVGLDADIAARAAATGAAGERLSTSTQPVRNNELGKYYSRRLPGGNLQGDAASDKMLTAVLDEHVVRNMPRNSMTPADASRQQGLVHTIEAGKLFNIRKNINEMLRDTYTLNGSSLSPNELRALRDIKGAIDAQLSHASPVKGSAAKDFKEFNTKYRDMSRPVNQKSNLRQVYEATEKGATVGTAMDETLNAGSLATSIKKLENNKAMWDQFDEPTKAYLRQLRHEAPANASSILLGGGSSVGGKVAEKAIPPSLLTMTRPLPSMVGRAASGTIRTLGASQIGRIEDELARILSEPGGIQRIEQILQGVNKPMPQASGRLGQFLLTGQATTNPLGY